MNSTNLFSSFIISSDSVFYNMEIEENKFAFVDFFMNTQYLVSEDEQFQLIDIATPLFCFDKGSLHAIPSGLASSRKQGIDFTPGELLQLDWYKDAFVFEYHPQSWCLPDTFEVLSKMKLDLIGQNMQYSCKLIAIDSGFLKEEFMWKRTSFSDMIF